MMHAQKETEANWERLEVEAAATVDETGRSPRRSWPRRLAHIPEEGGAALVEASLAMSILLILLSVALEGGWMYFTYLGLQSAAAEGAAYGMIHPTWQTATSETPFSANPNNIEFRARSASSSPLIDWENATVNVDVDFPTPGNLILVTVAYDYEPLSPLTQALLIDDSITLRATAVQTIMAAGGS